MPKLMISKMGLFSTLAAAIVVAGPAAAQQKVPVKFTLDWKYQGIHSWYLMAQKKGYFAAEGLDVTVDQGEGSAATVTRIMAGTYDAGFGDMTAIVQNAVTRPADAPVMVYMIYNRPPFAVMSLPSANIKSPKDLAGKKLGSPAGAAAHRLLPLMTKAAGVDASKIEVLNMAPNLQEQMLFQKQVDASLVFNVTAYMNVASMGRDPAKDVNWMMYGDHGVSVYSNGVMVSQKLVKERPAAVSGLVRAINKALHEAVADPDAAIKVLTATEPLLKADIEKQRLVYAMKTVVLSSEQAEIGIGDIKDARMKQAIDQIAEVFELKSKPEVTAVFNRTFLPPISDRRLKAAF